MVDGAQKHYVVGGGRPFFSRQMADRAKRCTDELVEAAISLCEPENVAGPHKGYTRNILTERFLTILAKHM